MPAIATVYARCAAGLLLGFGGALLWGLALAACGLGFALVRRRSELALLACLGLAALAWGAAGRSIERTCLTSITLRRVWLVQLHGDPAGGWWRGRWRSGRCRVPVAVQVRSGLPRPGGTYLVRGELLRQQERVQLREAAVVERSPPSLLQRARTRTGRTIDRLYPEQRALVRALVIADQREIERRTRDIFADSGLVHMLSVSGLHVAIIFAAIEVLAAIARCPPRSATAAALLLTAVYVAMIGAPAPAVRAAAMLGANALTKALQRPTSLWAIVALGGIIPLADPATVRDLGYQLSMAGIVGLVVAGEAARQRLPERLTGWRRTLAANLLATTLACVATMPISALAFGRTSLVAPLSNLLAAPIIAVVQPALFLSLAAAPLEPLARLVADGTNTLLGLFGWLATLLARLPFATVELGFTAIGGAALSVAALATLAAARSAYPARALACALGAAIIVACRPLLPVTRPVELHMIDVGQGDALALRTADGSWVLFDAGDAWRSGDHGERTVLPYIRRRGGAVRALVLSHPHEDHIGGAASLLRRTRPGTLVDGGYVVPTESYRRTLQTAAQRGIRWRRPHPGDSLFVPGATIVFLAPDSAWAAGLDDPNESSVVALVQAASWRTLLTGDAEVLEEAWLLQRYGTDLRADVLKVGHHGSATSSSDAFLDAVRPSVALVSVGEGNTYGHPSRVVLEALEARKTHVLRSDEDGSVVVRFERGRLTVEANGQRWRYSAESRAH
ncbi:MAG: DNA internalization-related competence protein ComEC/Rec2 [Gemmatimonadaceae bacterium]